MSDLLHGLRPTLERTYKGHRDIVTALSFNPNSKTLVSSSLDGCLMLWNFKPQLRAFRFMGHKGPVFDVKFSPSGNLIASAAKDQTVRLWRPNV